MARGLSLSLLCSPTTGPFSIQQLEWCLQCARVFGAGDGAQALGMLHMYCTTDCAPAPGVLFKQARAHLVSAWVSLENGLSEDLGAGHLLWGFWWVMARAASYSWLLLWTEPDPDCMETSWGHV